MEEMNEHMNVIDETLHDCNRLLSKMTAVTSTLKALSFEKERTENLHANLSISHSNIINSSIPDISSLSLSVGEDQNSSQSINPPPSTPVPIDTDNFPLKYEDWELWKLGSKQHQQHNHHLNQNNHPEEYKISDVSLSNKLSTHSYGIEKNYNKYDTNFNNNNSSSHTGNERMRNTILNINETGTENLEDLMGRMKLIEKEMQRLNSLQEHPNPAETDLMISLSQTMSTLQVNNCDDNFDNNRNNNTYFSSSNESQQHSMQQKNNEAMLEKHLNFANKVDRTIEGRKHVLQWFTELKDSFAEHIPSNMAEENIQNEVAAAGDEDQQQQYTALRDGKDQMEYEDQTNISNISNYLNEESLIQECERVGAQQHCLLQKLNDLVVSKQPYHLMSLPSSTDQQHYNQYM